MLDNIKKYTQSWLVQLLLTLLVVSFAVWGVADIFTGFGANTVAKVGNVEISGQELRRRYDLAMQQLTQQFGRQFTPQEAQQLHIPDQVLSRLLAEATLDETVREMHLSLSSDTVGRLLKTDPALLGPSGVFDRNLFAQIAQQQGMTENQFVLSRRAEYIRSQLAQALAGSIDTPAPMLQGIAEYRGDERKLSYLLLNAPAAAEIPDPSDTDLNAYFDAHKSDWRAPELRAVTYFVLSPEELAKPDEVTDEEAKQRYDSQQARFVTPETRHVSQIVFKDKADADAAAAALTGGMTFDELVAQRKLTPSDIDLGQVTKDKIIDPAIADAAFKLASGGVSGVIEGKFGPVIVRVDNVVPEVVQTFDDVKAMLKSEIANEKAVAEITDLHDSIEDARAGGDELAAVAAKYGLKMVTVPAVDATGKDADGNALPNLPAGLANAAFDPNASVGIPNDPIQPDANSYVWYDVTAITEARDRPLAEVHDKVVAAWKDAERQKKLEAKAADLKAKLDGGDDIAKVAADNQLEVKTADKVLRGMPAAGDLSAAAITAAFDGPKGLVATAAGAAPMTQLVFVVTDSTVPAFDPKAPELAQVNQQLASQYVQDLLAAYITERQEKIGVHLNNAAISAALGYTTETN
jgi:peptidyl-prolyl cis-trans isomerase D